MAILEKEVFVEINGANLQHLERLGYEIPRIKTKWGKISIPRGTKILIKVEHLTDGSKAKVTKICDMEDCRVQIPNIRYVDIIKKREKGDGKDRCFDCGSKKSGETLSNNVEYERTLEFCAKRDGLDYLLDEFSSKNKRKPNKVAYQSNKSFLWDCLKCGSEFPMKMNNRTSINKNSCPYCSGQKVNRTNSLYINFPEVAKLLTNKEDGNKYTGGSGMYVNFTCSDCGNIDKKMINNVVRHGFSCGKCSDGFSFPEKLMINLLSQLNIDFETQKEFDWSLKKRYDFFINSLNCIIETHGNQHYEDGTFKHLGGRSLEEEQKNDLLKENIARKYGINNYIVINCSESDINFIKNNILQSELPNMINLNNVNWMKCNEYACNSLVKTVCEMWNKTEMTAKEIGIELNIDSTTVRRYLIQGSNLHWCTYDKAQSYLRNRKNLGVSKRIKIVQLGMDGIFIKEWVSASEAGRQLDMWSSAITNVCNGKLNSTGGYRFMYKEQYENTGFDVSKVRPRVVQLSLDGEFIKEYRDSVEAYKSLGLPKQANTYIIKCCNKISKLAYGFKWVYKEDYDTYLKELVNN
jgi:hypothetical protein